jgi:predicted transcriptional regulator
MAINKIKKFNLESLAEELRSQDKSYADIADELCKVSNQNISPSSVRRYFESNERAMIKAVEKSHKLQEKKAEAEINTVEKRQRFISKLEKIADEAFEKGDLKGAIDALKEATSALNSLDKLLGKYETTPAVQVNLNQVNIDGEKRALLERIAAIPATDTTFEDVE